MSETGQQAAVERLKTGVKGFDELIEGGIPRGFFISIVGEPGTGKTIFSIHFAWEGIKESDRVIYVTTEESKESIVQQASQFGMNFRKGLNEKKMIIIDALMKSKEEEWTLNDLNIEELVSKVIEAKKALGYGRTRLVIDSMSAFWIDKPAMARKMSYYIKRVLYKWDVTAYLISQYAVTTDLAYGFGLEHIADGIIRFKKILSRGVLKRYVLVEKMRQTNHDLTSHEVYIKPGIGMEIGPGTEKKREDFRINPEVAKKMVDAKNKGIREFLGEEESEWPEK
ncbi:KaiC domain-containing protein [Fervidicoccus fontis]|uniref:KaiC domain-containing protein n=2 Tax=Fervidicoccus fontis TaxID=683846 RepID=A0A843AA78_9CREN|nr:KaiC domain-containing protein [Fervidicoccus fontis]AFH43355.1 putative ATPase [Fervidicoccus fontis Kam940]MBE9390732.1 KaiC domain-containing protein [Fervidicoccus fontis]